MELIKPVVTVGILSIIGGASANANSRQQRQYRILDSPVEIRETNHGNCKYEDIARKVTEIPRTSSWRPGDEEIPFTD